MVVEKCLANSESVPGVTKYTAFLSIQVNIEMDKYITGWSEDWAYFTRAICDIMDFNLGLKTKKREPKTIKLKKRTQK